MPRLLALSRLRDFTVFFLSAFCFVICEGF